MSRLVLVHDASATVPIDAAAAVAMVRPATAPLAGATPDNGPAQATRRRPRRALLAIASGSSIGCLVGAVFALVFAGEPALWFGGMVGGASGLMSAAIESLGNSASDH